MFKLINNFLNENIYNTIFFLSRISNSFLFIYYQLGLDCNIKWSSLYLIGPNRRWGISGISWGMLAKKSLMHEREMTDEPSVLTVNKLPEGSFHSMTYCGSPSALTEGSSDQTYSPGLTENSDNPYKVVASL